MDTFVFKNEGFFDCCKDKSRRLEIANQGINAIHGILNPDTQPERHDKRCSNEGFVCINQKRRPNSMIDVER